MSRRRAGRSVAGPEQQPELQLHGSGLVAGVDEAGRGPLAGPVVAAAVILDPARPIDGLADSKVLEESQRERLAVRVRRDALAFGVGFAESAEIDAINILQATFLAMRRALQALAIAPGHVQFDGNACPSLQQVGFVCTAEAIVGGDAKIAAISAASILAKTVRDDWMRRVDALYPEYGFARHKGYPTPQHLAALRQHGVTPLHRRSFGPVKSALLAASR